MKLGIALIVIGGGDLLLSVLFLATGHYYPVEATLMTIARFFIDILLLLYGIRRVIKARRKGTVK